MKKYVLHVLGVILCVVSGSACNDNQQLPMAYTPLSISVSTGHFQSADRSTRTLDNGYNTFFTKGDRIGIVAIDVTTGTVHKESKNIPYRYEEAIKTWISDTGEELKYYDGSYYIVYYPYMENINWIFDNNANAGYETCVKALYSHFFQTRFNPAEQSTQEKYASMDLMAGKAKVVLDEYNQAKLSVVLEHQFALILVDMKQQLASGGTKSLVPYVSDASDWQRKPFMTPDSVFRVLIKPSESQQFIIAYNRHSWNNEYLYTTTVNLPPGKYLRYNITLPE